MLRWLLLLLQGIIHRDVKPDNIAVQPDHSVRLFDWGEAVTLQDVHSLPERMLLRDVGMAGTPLFMAPEALDHLTGRSIQGSDALRGVLTTKLDVWGLGCITFFLLAGRDVFVGDDSWELDNIADVASCEARLLLPEGCLASPAARDFLAQCLEIEPEARASAKKLLSHPWLLGACSMEELAAAKAAAASFTGRRLVLAVADGGVSEDDEALDSSELGDEDVDGPCAEAEEGGCLRGDEPPPVCEVRLAPNSSTASLTTMARPGGSSQSGASTSGARTHA